MPLHKSCGSDHSPDTPCPEPLAQLRSLTKRAQHASDLARVQVLADIARLAQTASDRELVDITRRPGGQTQIAEALGITKQAAHLRVQHARKRLGGGS